MDVYKCKCLWTYQFAYQFLSNIILIIIKYLLWCDKLGVIHKKIYLYIYNKNA